MNGAWISEMEILKLYQNLIWIGCLVLSDQYEYEGSLSNEEAFQKYLFGHLIRYVGMGRTANFSALYSFTQYYFI